ncbi:uncharacterized protein SOCEGT47_001800 [Sorangium cellulosum]|uniref:Uncharacterized protein n=1 Tax=Sorangium cellulosum TaxID=56 RepID=A0A4P2PT62_SORCE|nr:uncharacterized protein SOCEGT47_001800 [Sorangium cellulosum]
MPDARRARIRPVSRSKSRRATGARSDAEDLPEELLAQPSPPGARLALRSRAGVERERRLGVLDASRGFQAEAARVLGSGATRPGARCARAARVFGTCPAPSSRERSRP